ncbi:MAG TPA: hypothetical protein VMF06_15830 [Candidatus Limnocylindria bacterium]|jgi:hypothetical protein|nr:hypothetical protein [Candidatus Limnocylindria bacterium]
MIPNHPAFLAAIHDRMKVCVRYYSKPDSAVLDRVCAPLDYGPGTETPEGPHRYWLWDLGDRVADPLLGLVSGQIVDLRVLGEAFNPALPNLKPMVWSVPRDWNLASNPGI